MKLLLISALLLLVPLASAKPVGTILYSNNGTTNFVVANGDDLDSLFFGYDNQNDVHVLMESNQTGFVGLLLLEGDLLKKEKTSLVIEWDLDSEGYASDSLKHLIKFTGRQIILREPSEDERKRLEDYKKKQTLKQNFKVVHQPRKLSVETCGLNNFGVNSGQNHGEALHSFEVETDVGYNSTSTTSIKFKADRETIVSKSFVIERQPGRNERDCENDEVAGLKPWYCKGGLLFRNLD